MITAKQETGKTEAFLLPILSRLWTQPKATHKKGMRCLILYPMNALVTDQVTRLYELLEQQQKLSLFHFTSETQETDRAAERLGERWQPCRRRSREAARASIPDIVITNYSMLEYMLCRPQDQGFFGSALEFFVLDEAHLYTGTLAAEITLLLRRVKDRCGVPSEQITHITDIGDAWGRSIRTQDFAATVFSVPRSAVGVIAGTKSPLRFDAPNPKHREQKPEEFAARSGIEISDIIPEGQFAAPDNAAVASLSDIFRSLAPMEASKEAANDAHGIVARFLKVVMEQLPIVRRMAKLLHDRDLSVTGGPRNTAVGRFNRNDAQGYRAAAEWRPQLAEYRDIAGSCRTACTSSLRALQGLVACLSAACTGRAWLRAGKIGCLQDARDRCAFCECITLPVHRCRACGQWRWRGTRC